MQTSKRMRKKETIVFVLLLICLLGASGCFSLYAWKRNTLFLWIFIGLFVTAIPAFILFVKQNKSGSKQFDETRKRFFETINLPETKTLYLVATCKDKHVLNPNVKAMDLYMEAYSSEDIAHIYDMSDEEREKSLLLMEIFQLSFPFLDRVKSKKIILSSSLYALFQQAERYKNFLNSNEFFPDGKTQGE